MVEQHQNQKWKIEKSFQVQDYKVELNVKKQIRKVLVRHQYKVMLKMWIRLEQLQPKKKKVRKIKRNLKVIKIMMILLVIQIQAILIPINHQINQKIRKRKENKNYPQMELMKPKRPLNLDQMNLEKKKVKVNWQ